MAVQHHQCIEHFRVNVSFHCQCLERLLEVEDKVTVLPSILGFSQASRWDEATAEEVVYHDEQWSQSIETPEVFLVNLLKGNHRCLTVTAVQL